MIHGIGCDLVAVARVAALYERYGERLLHRVLAADEIAQARAQASPVPRLAKYLAAKEAAFKAMGIGRNSGLGWRDYVVGYHEGGQPRLWLSRRAVALLPPGACAHLSLSDTAEHALAYVVIETQS